MGIQTRIFKCSACGAIVCLPKVTWQKSINCPTCDRIMTSLDDDFDLSEIVATEEKKDEQ